MNRFNTIRATSTSKKSNDLLQVSSVDDQKSDEKQPMLGGKLSPKVIPAARASVIMPTMDEIKEEAFDDDDMVSSKSFQQSDNEY